ITRYQRARAAIGTDIYLLTPRSSDAALMPTNSLTVTPPLAMTIMPIANRVHEIPNRSRIRSSSPRPVAAPRREHISWTTANDTVRTTITQIKSYPNFAPAELYVAIPPASFPADVAISPGPSTRSHFQAPRGGRRKPRR